MPIIEAFYKRVPVLAYAATAVPATMDGGGVLYDTTDPLEIARADGSGPRRSPRSRMPCSQSQDAALARLLARDFAGTLLRFVDQVARRPAAPGAAGRLGLLGASSSSSNASRSCGSSAGAFQALRRRVRIGDQGRGALPVRPDPDPDRRCRTADLGHRPMIINQWVPAAHRGDAIGDSARARARRCCAARGTSPTSSR